MDKFIVLEIDSHVGNATVAVGAEEDQITLAQVIQVNDAAVLFQHLGRIAVHLDVIDL